MAPIEITTRYEALRTAVLAHHVDMDRRGLALLRREGMAAWAAAWAACTPAPGGRTPGQRVGPLAEPTALIALLASMALSTVQELRS